MCMCDTVNGHCQGGFPYLPVNPLRMRHTNRCCPHECLCLNEEKNPLPVVNE